MSTEFVPPPTQKVPQTAPQTSSAPALSTDVVAPYFRSYGVDDAYPFAYPGYSCSYPRRTSLVGSLGYTPRAYPATPYSAYPSSGVYSGGAYSSYGASFFGDYEGYGAYPGISSRYAPTRSFTPRVATSCYAPRGESYFGSPCGYPEFSGWGGYRSGYRAAPLERYAPLESGYAGIGEYPRAPYSSYGTGGYGYDRFGSSFRSIPYRASSGYSEYPVSSSVLPYSPSYTSPYAGPYMGSRGYAYPASGSIPRQWYGY